MSNIETGMHGAHLIQDLARSRGESQLKSDLAERHLIHFSRSVVVERDRSADLLTRAAASILTTGPTAVLTSHTAVRLHGCEAADQAPVHVVVPYRRKVRSKPDMIVHHSAWSVRDVVSVHGLPVLALEHALAEMLCRARSSTAFACLEQALAMRPADSRRAFVGLVADCVLSRADRRGSRRAASLLELATGLTESPAESWVLLMLADAGLPPPVPQYPIVGIDGTVRYRLDFAWPDLRIALEYDGYAAHEGREGRDSSRDLDLMKRGWIVLRATSADLKDPNRLIDSVRTAFRQRAVAA
ncbi:DUF559 domain-containing protein [Actinocrispum sp. NPDC049592]|uniref:endonuclease domain-containing protein n=1 Tax=Actinocrispum sp. NPDC049592 TaxID=3154835 RepID=UPI003449C657